MFFLQGISYSNQLKLGVRAVQREWTNKNTLSHTACLFNQSRFKKPKGKRHQASLDSK